MKAKNSVKESTPLPQMVFSVEKMGGGTHSSIMESPDKLHQSSQMNENKKIISNRTYICWKQIFSQLSLAPFFKLFPLFQNYLPMQSQGQSLKVPRGLQTTHCFPPTGMHQLPLPGCLVRMRNGLCSRARGLIQVPSWFSYANSSTLAQFYLRWSTEHISRHCAKCFSRLYLISYFEKVLWVDIITLFYRIQ